MFKCPYHLILSVPLKLHSFLSKMTIRRFLPPPKIVGQKAESSHYDDSNEPQKILLKLAYWSTQQFPEANANRG